MEASSRKQVRKDMPDRLRELEDRMQQMQDKFDKETQELRDQLAQTRTQHHWQRCLLTVLHEVRYRQMQSTIDEHQRDFETRANETSSLRAELAQQKNAMGEQTSALKEATAAIKAVEEGLNSLRQSTTCSTRSSTPSVPVAAPVPPLSPQPAVQTRPHLDLSLTTNLIERMVRARAERASAAQPPPPGASSRVPRSLPSQETHAPAVSAPQPHVAQITPALSPSSYTAEPYTLPQTGPPLQSTQHATQPSGYGQAYQPQPLQGTQAPLGPAPPHHVAQYAPAPRPLYTDNAYPSSHPHPPQQAQRPLPRGWWAVYDYYGRPYYSNPFTGQRQWQRP
ncbi:putative WW domain-containing protein [Septoria linicola]|nr:putative WW domain-containing protein [Septoria linicola]